MSSRQTLRALGVVLAALVLMLTSTVGPAAAATGSLLGPANFGCDLVLDAAPTGNIGSARLTVGRSDGLAHVTLSLRKAQASQQYETRFIWSTPANDCIHETTEYFETSARGTAKFHMTAQSIDAARVRILVRSTSSSTDTYSVLFENLPTTSGG